VVTVSENITHHLGRVEESSGGEVQGREWPSRANQHHGQRKREDEDEPWGDPGVATVDSKHQVIVQAEAHGQGQEHGLLEPSVEQAHANLNHTVKDKRAVKRSTDTSRTRGFVHGIHASPTPRSTKQQVGATHFVGLVLRTSRSIASGRHVSARQARRCG